MPPSTAMSRLRQAAPDAVFCRISDFGITGTYAEWSGNEMIHQALSGIMYYNGRAGSEPLYGVGQRVQHVAGVAAYTAVLAALHRQQGELIDIDVHKTAASMSYNLANQFFYSGTFDERDGTKYNPDLLIKCQDGWVIVFVYAYRWEAFCDALGLAELKADPQFQSQSDRLARWDKVSAVASAAASHIPAAELVLLLQGAGVPAASSQTPADLAGSPHLEARGYWRSVETEDGNRRAFGAPFRLTTSQWRTDRPLAEGDAQ
jgi:crotonobetainyl-CoA:carnitine CoA-transferase CaiB-like acyl-CoA transferase